MNDPKVPLWWKQNFKISGGCTDINIDAIEAIIR